MKDYCYEENWKNLLTPEIVTLLTHINECKGRQNQLLSTEEQALVMLAEKAKKQSIKAANGIKGNTASDERMKKILQDKVPPANSKEEEIAGYRDALAVIYENYNYIELSPGSIMQMHRDLYKYSISETGGRYKNGFQSAEEREVPQAVEALCSTYNTALNEKGADPLIITAMFMIDFLCIHPFNDGNDRMCRLLMLLLLYRAGFMVGKYVSIEEIIEKTKGKYYRAIARSSFGWHENENDYEPFVRYMLEVILRAYRDFDDRTKVFTAKGARKPDQVREIIKDSTAPLTKREIMEKCAGVSEITVQRALANLQKTGEIGKLGGGRYTKYIWNRGKE